MRRPASKPRSAPRRPSKAPPIDRLAQGEDRRRAILEIAAALFAELGYRDTSTKLIAQRAGISEPLVFHHFGSKLGLLRALASTAGMTPVRVAEALAAAKDQPLATLPAQLARAWESGDADGRMIAGLATDASREPEVREIVGAVVERVQAQLEAVFDAHLAAGALRTEADPRVAASLVSSVLVGSRVLATMGHARASLEEQLEAVLVAFLPVKRSGWRA
jgi:AcrR family transcriptional regulator